MLDAGMAQRKWLRWSAPDDAIGDNWTLYKAVVVGATTLFTTGTVLEIATVVVEVGAEPQPDSPGYLALLQLKGVVVVVALAVVVLAVVVLLLKVVEVGAEPQPWSPGQRASLQLNVVVVAVLVEEVLVAVLVEVVFVCFAVVVVDALVVELVLVDGKVAVLVEVLLVWWGFVVELDDVVVVFGAAVVVVVVVLGGAGRVEVDVGFCGWSGTTIVTTYPVTST
jgi:hypothetical protein